MVYKEYTYLVTITVMGEESKVSAKKILARVIDAGIKRKEGKKKGSLIDNFDIEYYYH